MQSKYQGVYRVFLLCSMPASYLTCCCYCCCCLLPPTTQRFLRFQRVSALWPRLVTLPLSISLHLLPSLSQSLSFLLLVRSFSFCSRHFVICSNCGGCCCVDCAFVMFRIPGCPLPPLTAIVVVVVVAVVT